MGADVASLGKAFLTYVAGERFLSGVASLMGLFSVYSVSPALIRFAHTTVAYLKIT